VLYLELGIVTILIVLNGYHARDRICRTARHPASSFTPVSKLRQILQEFGTIPSVGDRIEAEGWRPHQNASKSTAEMALSVLAYNLTRVMNIVGIKPLIAAIVA
jgi:hypothetical protein